MGRMGALLCILSAAGVRRDGDLRQARLRRGRRGRRAAARALRARRGACCWRSPVARGALRGLPRRAVLAALAMGAVGYATQSGLFFSALERMDASLLALVLYTYPVLVCVGRGRAGARARVGAADRRAGGRVGRRRARARGRGERQLRRARRRDGVRRGAGVHRRTSSSATASCAGVPLLALSALVCTGAAATFLVAARRARRAGAVVRRGRAGLDRRDRARQHGRRRSSRSSRGWRASARRRRRSCPCSSRS